MKTYNQKTFEASVNGKDYTFFAWSTQTRNGFCHNIETWCGSERVGTRTKQSYINRTWERFGYETVLRRAIDKCAAADREKLRAILIDGTAQREKEKAAAFLNTFQGVWGALNDQNKKQIAKAVGTIESEAQAERVAAVAKFALMLQKIQK